MVPRFGVIFDMDGVLVDSAEAHFQAWHALGLEIGIAFTRARFQLTFGQTNAAILPAWLGALRPAEVDALGRRKEALYRSLVTQGAARAYPGGVTLLAALRDGGAVLAIASSGPRENVDLLVDTLGVRAMVDVTVAAEDVARGKPDPEVFLLAAARLGIRPAYCAVVEDSTHGIEAAHAAGMVAVGVLTSTDARALRRAGADVLVPSVGAIRPDWLLTLLPRDE